MKASTKTASSRRARTTREDTVSSSASSVGRVFEILDLFSVERPVLRIDEIGSLLGYTRSTSYRYVKALGDAGLIAPVGAGCYSLGARAVELDRLLQLTDPLLHAGQAVMPTLLAASMDSAFLLCTLYGDKVLCIHHEGPLALKHRERKVNISRPRGSPFPLFSGAASLVILANLPGYRIKSLFLKHHHEIQQTGLAQDWQGFRTALGAIRQQGYAFSTGTFNPHLGGVAVPVSGDGVVLGSLTEVRSRDHFTPEAQGAAAHTLTAAAARIANRVVLTQAKAA